MSDRGYSVLVGFRGPVADPNRAADALVDELERETGGPAVSATSEGVVLRFSLVYPDERLTGVTMHDLAGVGEAVARRAMDQVGLRRHELEHLSVETDDHLERELGEPLPELVGLSEVAEILGVSKQRVGQLRERPDFPQPIAELAAGPVWSRAMLDRFTHEWPRRAGRPRAAAKSA